jgi:hypothetical protein
MFPIFMKPGGSSVCVRFEILNALTDEGLIDPTSCSLVDRDQRFLRTYCLHLQGARH